VGKWQCPFTLYHKKAKVIKYISVLPQTNQSEVMSLVISFLNQKGGVGKSTLSINVAACLSLFKQNVLLIDADKQGTTSTWASLRNETGFQVVSMSRENMALDALKLASNFDLTIIDGPPQAEAISRSCIVASDLVVVPIEPGGASLWSSNLTIRQIKEAKELKQTIKSGFVVSRKIGSTILGRDARSMVIDAGIAIFRTEIEQRVAYAEALTMGKTIFEWSDRSSAAKEIQTLTYELMDVFNEQNICKSTKTKNVNGR
jgi:chromosome partitioning protein